MENDLAFADLTALCGMLQRREVSSVEAVLACLEQISTHGERLHAFTEVFFDDALGQAKNADQMRDRGENAGPLHGIPIAVKDLLDIAGRVNTGGTACRKDAPPAPHSAPAVAALENAGAIVIGKANLDELAFGVASQNEHFGFVHNPWGENLIPGGSSGGSAVALAAGMAYGALGTDTGGSVRIPASVTATSALKVTTGLISTAGCIAVSGTLDSVGPMARSVRDLEIMLNLLEQTGTLRTKPGKLAGNGVSGLRLGIEEQHFFNRSRMSADCQTVMDSVLSDLESVGIELVPIKLPSIGYAEAAQKAIVLAEAANYHSGPLRELRPLYGSIIKPNLVLGDAVLAGDYLKAMDFRFVLAREFAAAFEYADFVVTPGVPFAPTSHDVENYVWPDGSSDHIFDAAWRNFFPTNLVGLPSLALPCGLSDAGTPIGLQLIAPALCERDLLTAGTALTRKLAWQFRAPGVQGTGARSHRKEGRAAERNRKVL